MNMIASEQDRLVVYGLLSMIKIGHPFTKEQREEAGKLAETVLCGANVNTELATSDPLYVKRLDKPAPEPVEGNLKAYPFDIPQVITDRFLASFTGSTAGELSAVGLKFDNPYLIDNVLRNCFNADKTHKGRVWAYAVLKPATPEEPTVMSGEVSTLPGRQQEVVALFPIGPHAEANAILFSRAANQGSFFLQRYYEAREEIDQRDRKEAEAMAVNQPNRPDLM